MELTLLLWLTRVRSSLPALVMSAHWGSSSMRSVAWTSIRIKSTSSEEKTPPAYATHCLSPSQLLDNDGGDDECATSRNTAMNRWCGEDDARGHIPALVSQPMTLSVVNAVDRGMPVSRRRRSMNVASFTRGALKACWLR